MADLKTALKTAIATAPSTTLRVKTNRERIWLWIKDHPGVSVKRVIAELNLPAGSVTQELWQMTVRKMVLVEKVTAPSGVRQHRYSVNPKMRGEYENWPMPERENDEKQVAVWTAGAPAPAVPAAASAPKPAEAPVKVPLLPDTDIEGLTIKQAREVYEKLHKLFGGK